MSRVQGNTHVQQWVQGNTHVQQCTLLLASRLSTTAAPPPKKNKKSAMLCLPITHPPGGAGDVSLKAVYIRHQLCAPAAGGRPTHAPAEQNAQAAQRALVGPHHQHLWAAGVWRHTVEALEDTHRPMSPRMRADGGGQPLLRGVGSTQWQLRVSS
jgi:hypothetical protein